MWTVREFCSSLAMAWRLFGRSADRWLMPLTSQRHFQRRDTDRCAGLDMCHVGGRQDKLCSARSGPLAGKCHVGDLEVVKIGVVCTTLYTYVHKTSGKIQDVSVVSGCSYGGWASL